MKPSLQAVSPVVADAFIAGLRRAFLILGSWLMVGMIITFLKGELRKESPVAAPQGELRVTPSN